LKDDATQGTFSFGPARERAEAQARRPAVLSVAQVAASIREILETSFPWILVRGEITNLSRPQSGHVYFSLVDDAGPALSARTVAAQLPCVVWRSAAVRMRCRLENGAKVVAAGRLGVYEPRGTYQLIAEQIESTGLGDLQRRFEELKERLRREGLFDPERKRPLPFLPGTIGLVTSPTGAALGDVLRAVYRRHTEAHVRIVPVRVQGLGAAEEIAAAIDLLGSAGGQADVVVLARGGGSLEDLWAFNEEVVARSIAACPVPVVSAVGHEVDFSIADFVADVRAQTPTKAAELIVPDLADLQERLRRNARRLSLGVQAIESAARARVERLLGTRPVRRPTGWVDDLVQRCDDLARGLDLRLYNAARRWDDAVRALASRLEALSPLGVLARGYSLVTDEAGRIVRSSETLAEGQPLDVRFSRGSARVRVTKTDGREPLPVAEP
jgi:exodeoxyribonuclease VII large subunit